MKSDIIFNSVRKYTCISTFFDLSNSLSHFELLLVPSSTNACNRYDILKWCQLAYHKLMSQQGPHFSPHSTAKTNDKSTFLLKNGL